MSTAHLRLIYEKRNGACFVPHVALATVFTRAAVRAGIRLRMTEGFSSHAKISFGPELPAGVVALAEPFDVWVEEGPERLREAWDAQMPEGFRIRNSVALPEEAPALGKACKAAHYMVWRREGHSADPLLAHLKNHYGEDVLSGFVEEYDKISRISFVLAAPAKNGIGGWVRALVASEVVQGWQDLCIVRVSLGSWNGVQMESLTEEGVMCLRTEK